MKLKLESEIACILSKYLYGFHILLLTLSQQEEFQAQALPSNFFPPPLSSAERKQRWEQGQADYMGMDSFENIEKKLAAFLK